MVPHQNAVRGTSPELKVTTTRWIRCSVMAKSRMSFERETMRTMAATLLSTTNKY